MCVSRGRNVPSEILQKARCWCVSRGRNVPSEILQTACCWCGNDQFFDLSKSFWLLLAAALQPLLLLLLLLLDSLLPLLLPRPLLWLLQLPAAKHHGPKGRSESKIYVFRGRNVPSEILQTACCWCGNISFYLFNYCCCCWTHCCRCYCHGRCSGCCCSSRQQNTMALKDEASPKYAFPGVGTSLLKTYKKLAAGAEISVFTFLRAAGCC